MRPLVVIASGVFAFVLTCLFIEHLLPEELPWLVREKVTYLAAHGNEYDALFLGSSRVAVQIIPALFDRTAAEQGLAIKSFNAGISGMYPPQDAYVLDRILEAKPARLRWVFVELQPLAIELPPTPTAILWSWCIGTTGRDSASSAGDWPRPRSAAIGGTGCRTRVPICCLPELGGHALLFARRFANAGRGSLLFQRWVSHEQAPPLNWALPGRESRWLEVPENAPAMDEKARASVEEELAKRRRIPPVKDDQDTATQKALDVMVMKIQRAGATPILLVPPNAGRASYF